MQKEKSKKVVKRKRKKSPLKTVFSLSIIAFSCYLLYSSSQIILVMLSLKSEISVHNSEIKSLKTKQSTLTNQRDKLKDPEYVLRYARDKFLVTKPGEQVLKLPGGNSEK